MPILECNNLTKRFGSVEALTDVSFSVEPGRIVVKDQEAYVQHQLFQDHQH